MLTGRPAPPSGEFTLDRRLCAELGSELARAREERGLTAAQVGEQLLLSTRQVRALETVDFAAFHNATFHLGALRKYVAFAGVDEGRLAAIASGLVRPDPQAVMLVPSESSEDANDSSSSRLLSAAGTLLAVAVLAGGGFYLAQLRQAGAVESVATSPPVSAPAPEPPLPPAASEPAVVPVVEAPPPVAAAADSSLPVVNSGTFGSLRVLHPTWVFIRDADNAVIERSLGAGESFTFETQPTYLAVGTSDAELTIGTRTVDVSTFVVNGQIRIRAGDFDALVHGSPIPAPTPAARP